MRGGISLLALAACLVATNALAASNEPAPPFMAIGNGANALAAANIRFGHWADMKADFGVLANGGDDTATINAAVTAFRAAGGGTLYMPPGTYNTSGIINQSTVTIEPAGIATHIICHGSPCIGQNSTETLWAGGFMGGAHISGTADPSPATAVRLSSIQYSIFGPFYFDGFTHGTLLDATGIIPSTINNTTIGPNSVFNKFDHWVDYEGVDTFLKISGIYTGSPPSETQVFTQNSFYDMTAVFSNKCIDFIAAADTNTLFNTYCAGSTLGAQYIINGDDPAYTTQNNGVSNQKFSGLTFSSKNALPAQNVINADISGSTLTLHSGTINVPTRLIINAFPTNLIVIASLGGGQYTLSAPAGTIPAQVMTTYDNISVATGTFANNQLTLSGIVGSNQNFGPGSLVSGSGVLPSTVIVPGGSATGGAGVYQTNNNQNVGPVTVFTPKAMQLFTGGFSFGIEADKISNDVTPGAYTLNSMALGISYCFQGSNIDSTPNVLMTKDCYNTSRHDHTYGYNAALTAFLTNVIISDGSGGAGTSVTASISNGVPVNTNFVVGGNIAANTTLSSVTITPNAPPLIGSTLTATASVSQNSFATSGYTTAATFALSSFVATGFSDFWFTNAAPLASASIGLPCGAEDGDKLSLGSFGGITSLAITACPGSGTGIQGAPSSLPPTSTFGACLYRFKFYKQSNYYIPDGTSTCGFAISQGVFQPNSGDTIIPPAGVNSIWINSNSRLDALTIDYPCNAVDRDTFSYGSLNGVTTFTPAICVGSSDHIQGNPSTLKASDANGSYMTTEVYHQSSNFWTPAR